MKLKIQHTIIAATALAVVALFFMIARPVQAMETSGDLDFSLEPPLPEREP